MKKLILTSLLAGGVLVLNASAGTLAYQGNFDGINGLVNEVNSGSGVTALTYDNFIVPAGQTWDVTGLFSNNLADISWNSAFWDIRKGVSAGNGGTDIASGSAAATDTATGRSGFGFTEYQAMVSGLNIELTAGTYWLAVSPISSNGGGEAFVSTTSGAGGINNDLSGNSYLESAYFGANYERSSDFFSGYDTPGFSMGVVGTVGGGTPEPASFLLIAGGLGLIGIARKRMGSKKSL